MADWQISALIQYPIVVVVGTVAWYAYRELKQTNEEFRKYEREQHEEKLKKLEAANKLRIEAKNADVARWEGIVEGKLREIGEGIDEVKRKLP